jgi:hypothetical protein
MGKTNKNPKRIQANSFGRTKLRDILIVYSEIYKQNAITRVWG